MARELNEMQKFTKHTGQAVAIFRANIDTDQIIPKQFLKRIERTGYGEFLFYDWRYGSDGTPVPDFELNDPRHRDATVLIAGANFGCGSSREHAPWAIAQYGFRAVIAPSFADIFYNNSLKNGLVPVRLSEADTELLARRAASETGHAVTVDLENLVVTDNLGFRASFEISEASRQRILNGLDDIALTLRHESAIDEFEMSRSAWKSFPA